MNSHILDRITDFLMTVLNVADFIRLYGERQTRRFLKLELQLSAIMIISFIAGIALGWQALAVFSAFFTAIMGVVIWKQTEIFANMLCALSGIKLEVNNAILETMLKPVTKTVELGQKAINPVAESIKKLLLPLTTVSLAISFLASYIALKGLDNLNLYDLMIHCAVILFLAIFFWVYLATKEKWAGKAMFVWLLWLIASNYLWPIQCQELLETAENKTIGWAIGRANESRGGIIVNIAAGTSLYQYDHGNIKFLKVAGKDTRAKIIGRKKSPISQESMLKVVGQVDNMDNFIGGEVFLVPAGLTSADTKSSRPAQKTWQTTTFQPGLETVPVGTHTFTVNKTTTDWIRIPGKAEWDLSPTKNGNWRLITFEGEVITYATGEKKIGEFPDRKSMVFKIQTGEELGFILKVKESKST